MGRIKTELYILKRRIKAFGDSLCFYACRIFPIKKNLISVCTFEGKGGFGCNPKYLVQALHKQKPDYEFVWFVNDMNKEFPNYIKKVPNTLLNRAYYLTRSKVWIDNYRKPYGTVKRKAQYYLNVNHYTIAIKCTGLWRGKGFSKMAYLVSKNDSDMIDDLVIDSRWCEEVSPKGLVYGGTYQMTGAPRVDVMYGDRTVQKENFRKKHNLPLDAKILMYAPTFREGAKDGKRFVFSEIWSLDFKRLINVLEKKFTGTWYICVRVHPQLAPTFEDYKDEEVNDRIINESKADDMYEILAAMDGYITDYSSACFEAGYAKIPVFIYADDIQKYANDRGELMWNIATDPLDNVRNNKDITPTFDAKFPFAIATNNDELEQIISKFNEKEYEIAIDDIFDELGIVFTGHASEDLAEVIKSIYMNN
ncbi:MAG: CDP-glycerol glycerophosphotransferase family protein [Lachnospiraceae bacterium]|nr:CDP-glycerol glycerophosphotransferase family protein [Lachnospiraceae bacterium]